MQRYRNRVKQRAFEVYKVEGAFVLFRAALVVFPGL